MSIMAYYNSYSRDMEYFNRQGNRRSLARRSTQTQSDQSASQRDSGVVFDDEPSGHRVTSLLARAGPPPEADQSAPPRPSIDLWPISVDLTRPYTGYQGQSTLLGTEAAGMIPMQFSGAVPDAVHEPLDGIQGGSIQFHPFLASLGAQGLAGHFGPMPGPSASPGSSNTGFVHADDRLVQGGFQMPGGFSSI